MTRLIKTNFDPRHSWIRGEFPPAPVEFDQENGIWHVYGHAETLAVLADPVLYSSDVARRFVPGAEQWDFDGNLTQLDPPEHKKLRALVSRAFTSRVVDSMEGRIREVTAELLDAITTDSFELVAELAYPLPVIVIAELLGIPRDDHGLFRAWADESLAQRGQLRTTDEDGEQAKSIAAQREGQQSMNEYLLDHVRDRRRNVGTDLLSKLVNAEIDGDQLTDNEIVNFASLLIFAGHVTTTMLLGNTLLCFDAFEEEQERVRNDRTLVAGAIEESLRYLTPLAASYRATTANVNLGGIEVPRDQMLEVWFAAANRDSRAFTNPNTFDVTRDPNPHLGFGRGIHFCLGAPLARLEGKIVLNMLLDRFSQIRVDHDAGVEILGTPDFTGVWSLPLITQR